MKFNALIIFLSILFNSLSEASELPSEFENSEGPWVVNVYYQKESQLRQYASVREPWHVNTVEKYFSIDISSLEEYENLLTYGFKIEINRKQTEASKIIPDTIQKAIQNKTPLLTSSIPGFSCYRTVEETYSTMDDLVASYPALASIVDIGDSWEKTEPGGNPGYDLRVIKITNSSIPGPKPKLFAISSIHARELTPAELNTRFAEYLLHNYGTDADATWLVDHREIHLLLQGNPDGRKIAESGASKRKNENNNHCGGSLTAKGVDMNRNFGWMWNQGTGSSGSACDETYRGPSAQSEPENQAIDTYLKTLFSDQRGPGINDPAPNNTTGVYLDIHSYSELVLFPYGFDDPGAIPLAPNHNQLQTLARKFAWYNDYFPKASNELYGADGASDDNAYGQLGVAAYTFELGTSFFQDCGTFENTIYPDNLKALIYAAKVADTPYITASGPDIESMQLSSVGAVAGNQITVSGVATDQHFSANNGNEGTHNIQSVHMFVDELPWMQGSTLQNMSASDGSFNSVSEAFSGQIDTTGMAVGQHTIYFVANDSSGTQGVPYALFFDIWDVNDVGTLSGVITDALTSQPIPDVQVSVNETHQMTNGQGEYSFELLQGDYNLTASKSFYSPATYNNLSVTGLTTTTQDIQLQPICAMLDDNVESYSTMSDAETAGWSHGANQGNDNWNVNNSAGRNGSQSFNTDDVASPTDKFLISPSFDVSENTSLEFWHSYVFEGSSTYYDGAVLEISTDSGANWQDLGANMTSGSYNVTLSGGNVLGARSAWGGSQTTFAKVVVDLSSFNGSTVQIRWRFGSDSSVGAGDWNIDDIQVLDPSACVVLPDPIFDNGFEVIPN